MGLFDAILKVLTDASGDKYHLHKGSQNGNKTTYLKKGPKSLGAKGKTLTWFKW